MATEVSVGVDAGWVAAVETGERTGVRTGRGWGSRAGKGAVAGTDEWTRAEAWACTNLAWQKREALSFLLSLYASFDKTMP